MNSITILGRLGRDPEQRATTTGKTLVKFSVAVRETADKATWFEVVAWEKTAEAAMRLKKGDMVGLEGRMQRDEYEKDGEKRTAWSLVAHRVHYTGRRDDAAAAPTASAQTPFDDNAPF